MKHTKRILAFLTAILLLLPLAGCLVPNESESATEAAPSGVVPAPDGANQSGTGNALDFDFDAVAIELGDIKITAGEVQTMFDQYVSMFSYGSGLTAEMLGEFLRMTEEWLIEYYVPLWKAEQLGVKLTEEAEAEIAAEAEKAVAEERNELLCLFAEEFTDLESVTDASVLTEEQLATVLDAIDAELLEMFGEGYTFDDYLAARNQDYTLSMRLEQATALLQDRVLEDFSVDQATVDEWYETALEAQKTKYDASPEEFYYDALGGEDGTLILYAPDGYARVQVIELIPDGEPDEKIEENRIAMAALQTEYGALVLDGSDPDRIAAIEVEYAALKAETEALEEAHFGSVRKKIEEAYAALEGGLSFEEAMDAYNPGEADGTRKDERLVYLAGVDTHNGDIAALAKTLEPGAYSKPVEIDGAYVIVKLVERIPAGVVDRASIEEDIRIAAARESKDSAWETQLDAWLQEALEAAVYHRETYESLTDLYLNSEY
ncbi:MAG: peptidyl-prolyl cis-trans isomerase [Clostridia bacterium]|nr:peptidyl-prolyl cis-trans isomerase [Clostridia bacterium]